MFEIKKTETKKVLLKDLSCEAGVIVDLDGNNIDLNKIALSTFNEGDLFKFQVDNKKESSSIVDDTVEE